MRREVVVMVAVVVVVVCVCEGGGGVELFTCPYYLRFRHAHHETNGIYYINTISNQITGIY